MRRSTHHMPISLLPLFDCISAEWSPGIGDPDFYGWFGVALYGLAAVFAVQMAVRGPFPSGQRQRGAVLWFAIALLMAFLSANKQLDLQSLLLVGGRCVAQHAGWYDSRRLVQRDFILGLALLIVLSAWVMVRLFRSVVQGQPLLLAGLAAVAGFVLIRGMHLLHVLEPEDLTLDRLVHVVTTVLELLGPSLILAAEWRILRGSPHRRNVSH